MVGIRQHLDAPEPRLRKHFLVLHLVAEKYFLVNLFSVQSTRNFEIVLLMVPRIGPFLFVVLLIFGGIEPRPFLNMRGSERRGG